VAGNGEPRELASWKEIANYLSVSERTAQNWEREKGLPIRRYPGEKGRVLAYASELDQWKQRVIQRPSGETRRGRIRLYGGVAAILLLALLGLAAWSGWGPLGKGAPAAFRIEFNTLIVTDAAGRELWRKVFPDALPAERYAPAHGVMRRIWFGDLEGDGRVETLFVYDPSNRDLSGTTLMCFSDRGDVRWRFVPGRSVRTRIGRYEPPYLVENFLVSPLRPGSLRIVVSSHHLSWYPNQIAILDANGKLHGEYWHSGFLQYLDTADLDGDGVREIYLAGVNNGYRAATLVVLDDDRVKGASSQENNPDYQLEGFEPAAERARLIFARSCLNRKFDPFNEASGVRVSGDTVTVEVVERLDHRNAGVIYTLNRSLDVVAASVSYRFRALHRDLEVAGQIDHAISERELEELRGLRDLRKQSSE
jgi:hypothetical protein